jgi:hypothetical protein
MRRQGGGTPTFQRTKILARCLCVCVCPVTRLRIAVRATAILIGLGSHCIACHGVAAAAAGEGPVATVIGGRKKKDDDDHDEWKGRGLLLSIFSVCACISFFPPSMPARFA